MSYGSRFFKKNSDYKSLHKLLVNRAGEEKADEITAYAVKDGKLQEFKMTLGDLTDDEREIILKGCLINYYKGQNNQKI